MSCIGGRTRVDDRIHGKVQLLCSSHSTRLPCLRSGRRPTFYGIYKEEGGELVVCIEENEVLSVDLGTRGKDQLRTDQQFFEHYFMSLIGHRQWALHSQCKKTRINRVQAFHLIGCRALHNQWSLSDRPAIPR
jgi:hypothetical protein